MRSANDAPSAGASSPKRPIANARRHSADGSKHAGTAQAAITTHRAGVGPCAWDVVLLMSTCSSGDMAPPGGRVPVAAGPGSGMERLGPIARSADAWRPRSVAVRDCASSAAPLLEELVQGVVAPVRAAQLGHAESRPEPG